jgi:hypothetical protein
MEDNFLKTMTLNDHVNHAHRILQTNVNYHYYSFLDTL